MGSGVAIYSPLIRRLAAAQGMQAADADDLVQEVFAAIARSIAKWLDRPDRGGFRAWLLTIARNAAVNHLTRRGTQSLAAGGDDAAALMAEVAAPPYRRRRASSICGTAERPFAGRQCRSAIKCPKKLGRRSGCHMSRDCRSLSWASASEQFMSAGHA